MLQAEGRRKVCQTMGGKWKKVLLGEEDKWGRKLHPMLGFGSGGKKFCLAFPEGRGLKKGWFLLAEKLRFLGVTLSSEEKNPTLKGLGVGVEKKKGLKLGERGDFVKIEKKNMREEGEMHYGFFDFLTCLGCK